jgi:hypothetical protein
MKKFEKLYRIAKELSESTPGFLDTKGPGAGNLATNEFISELGKRAMREFGEDFSEKNICGKNSLAVDFYFPEDVTVVEIALGLKHPNSEFEKDILKVLMAKSLGNKIEQLVFISKPGGVKKCNQPGRVAVKEWLKMNSEMSIMVMDL